MGGIFGSLYGRDTLRVWQHHSQHPIVLYKIRQLKALPSLTAFTMLAICNAICHNLPVRVHPHSRISMYSYKFPGYLSNIASAGNNDDPHIAPNTRASQMPHYNVTLPDGNTPKLLVHMSRISGKGKKRRI